MWPFSTIRKLRASAEHFKKAYDDVYEEYNKLLIAFRSMETAERSVRLQNDQQAETIRRLTEELEQARKNDVRGPNGRFIKKPEVAND